MQNDACTMYAGLFYMAQRQNGCTGTGVSGAAEQVHRDLSGWCGRAEIKKRWAVICVGCTMDWGHRENEKVWG